jgi:hypothetical protein
MAIGQVGAAGRLPLGKSAPKGEWPAAFSLPYDARMP